MASKETEHVSTCLVCFETRPLKIVGNCKHSFCTECLSAVLGSLDSGSEVFACPSCKVDCPRPWDGVKGLVDFTGKDVTKVMPEIMQERSTGKVKKKKKHHPVVAKCQLCEHRKKDVQAVSLCVQCGHFYFCQDCTDNHSTYKATRNHSVTTLTTVKKDVAVCEAHDTDLTSFCQTCGEAVCTVCVMLDHSDHAIQELGETINSKVDLLKSTLEKQEKKLTDMQDLQKEFTLLKRLASMVNKQDILIKEIEDHAQKCIDQIVKWKEDLKTQLKADFKVIRDVPIGFEKVTKVVEKLEDVATRASKLLGETEHHPVYLDKLVALQQELESIDGIGDDVEGKEFRNKLQELHWSNPTFIPEVMNTTFGEISINTSSEEFKPTEIFTTILQVDSKDMFIPCVANLGEKFAVAHPTREGEPSNAIDIYEFPGTLIKTLRDHVPPIYDMSATPDGKLAVLSDGTVDSSCSVQVFDSDTGFISSTCDVDAAKPIAIGVTLQNQFVILGDNEQGQTQIMVADKDGVVQHRLLLNQGSEKVENPSRITCGGRFIFVKGDSVAVFEIKRSTLQAIKSGVINSKFLEDISATVWDDFFVTDRYIHSLDLENNPYEEKTLQWSRSGYKRIHENATGADREARVSTRDGHIVVSHGQTVRVYKL